jgi:glycosyltransferase involved in cell wall biosynthesis
MTERARRTVTARILHIVDSLAAAELPGQLPPLLKRLNADEFEQHVCALSSAPEAPLELTGAHTLSVMSRSRRLDLAMLSRLCHVKHLLRPDLVHLWTNRGPILMRWAVNSGTYCPLVQSTESFEQRRGFLAGYRQWLNRKAAAIVADSHAQQQRLLAGGQPAETVHLIREAADPANGRADRNALLAQLRLPDEVRLIGAAGPMHVAKPWKDLIWAADLLKVVRDDVHLLIAGIGPVHDRLERFREQVEIEDRVHFLGPAHTPAQVLPGCDIAWFPTATRGLPTGLATAMSAGVPTIACGGEASAEVIRSGENGYLVAAGDRAGLARVTQRLLGEPALAALLGKAAREYAAAHLGVERMVADFAAVYRQVLSRRSAAPRSSASL